jgi:hypothetical protein
MMDTNDDVAIYAIMRKIKNSRDPFPCKEYEETSRDISLCAHCGHDHRFRYYELAPGASPDPKHKFLAVDTADGSTEYIEDLPNGADAIGPAEGNA